MKLQEIINRSNHIYNIKVCKKLIKKMLSVDSVDFFNTGEVIDGKPKFTKGDSRLLESMMVFDLCFKALESLIELNSEKIIRATLLRRIVKGNDRLFFFISIADKVGLGLGYRLEDSLWEYSKGVKDIAMIEKVLNRHADRLCIPLGLASDGMRNLGLAQDKTVFEINMQDCGDLGEIFKYFHGYPNKVKDDIQIVSIKMKAMIESEMLRHDKIVKLNKYDTLLSPKKANKI